VVVFFGVSSIIMAQQWIGIKSVIELSIVVGAMIPGGILGVFALGFLFRWTTARGTYIGVAVSIIFNSWAAFTRIILPGMETTLLDFGRFNYTLSPFVIGIFSLFVLMGVGMIASLLAGGPRPDTKDLTFWDVLERRREEALERVKKSKGQKVNSTPETPLF